MVLLAAIGLQVAGCAPRSLEGNRGFGLQSGDLLLQDTDGGPLCDAIEKVTVGYRGAHFTHVGMVLRDDSGRWAVIEAISDGVCVTPLQAFLQRSLDSEHHPKVVVGRLEPGLRHLIAPALAEALALKGRPYDKVFAINNDSYYCSELIYEAFRGANNNRPVFTLQPMTFKDPETGAVMPAWSDYFSELDAPVPEGKPGINPGGISRSPALTIIHAYGVPDGWTTRGPAEKR